MSEPPRPMQSLLGTTIADRYVPTAIVGRGGMGVVHAAEDLREGGALVAFKALARQSKDPVRVQRFEREIEVMRRISHPAIVAIRDYGWLTSSEPWFVMELLDGTTLRERIERGPVAPAELGRLLIYGTEVAITVEIQNFAVELGTGHWHLWLNGQLRGMLYQTSGIVDLRPGSYQLCASLGDPNHMDLGMPDGITFTVQEPSAGTPVATLTVPREAAPVIDEPGGLTPVHLVLILGLGLVAIALGARLGSRFPKRRSPKR